MENKNKNKTTCKICNGRVYRLFVEYDEELKKYYTKYYCPNCNTAYSQEEGETNEVQE